MGDLDVYVWDAAANQPAPGDAGSESTDDNETFDHSGSALVRIHGYDGASAPYTLRLEAL